MKFFKLTLFTLILAQLPCTAAAQYYNDEQREIDELRQEVAALNEDRAEQQYKEKQKRIWGYGRYKRISYISQTMTREAISGMPETKWKPDYGFGLQIGNSYMLPHKPIGGVLKFGIDATWMDISYTRYLNATVGSFATNDPGTTGGIPNFNFPENAPETEIMLGDLGVHQATASMGIGLSANVAPFAFSSNTGLQCLKFQLYGHFLMGASAIIYDNPDTNDTEMNFAPVPQWACGLSLNWRQLGVGIEGRWGSAKYKNLVSESDFSSDAANDVEHPKVTFKNSAFRVYLNFHF